jgi:hypothetical protein
MDRWARPTRQPLRFTCGSRRASAPELQESAQAGREAAPRARWRRIISDASAQLALRGYFQRAFPSGMDDSAPETWADASPLEEAEFTYSNMTSFLSGMGVGPFATGRGAKAGPRLGGAPDGDDPLGLDEADASPRTRMRVKRGRRETAGMEHVTGIHLSEEDFDPARFLAVRHQDASYEQLKSGLDTLSTTISDHKRLLKSLVLQHFDQFLRCKDSIDSLQEGLQDQGAIHVDRVNELYDELAESGDKLYKPLLDAKRDTERTRSGLQVLRQYRFLFEIPATIHDNIEAKEYDKVVKEYRRAKLLVSTSERPVYRRVWKEVERIATEFRTELLDTLTAEAELPWEQHRPLVDCLVQLDCPVNPVGQLLLARQRCLQNLLDDAYQTLQARVDTAADREWERISMERSVLYDADSMPKRATSDSDGAASEQRVRTAIRHSCTANLSAEYLHKISAIVIERVPSMCDAASQLSGVQTDGGAAEVGGFPPNHRTSVSSATGSSVPAGDPPVLGELLENALSVYCARVVAVLGTDAQWWRREFVVAIRGCRDSLRACSQRFRVPWSHFRAVAQLDGRVAWRYAEMRWEATVADVASIGDQICLRAAAGISETGDALGGFLHPLPSLAGGTTGVVDESLAFGERQQWDTMSPTERAMEDTIGAFEQTMRQAFTDLGVVYTNASALKGSSEKLQTLSRAAMFEACGCFADCIHQIAFEELPKQQGGSGSGAATAAREGSGGGGVHGIGANLLDGLALGTAAGDDAVTEDPLLLLLRLLHHAIHVTIPALFDELPAVTQIDDETEETITLEAALSANSPAIRSSSGSSPRSSQMQQPNEGAGAETGLIGQLAEAATNAKDGNHLGRTGVLGLFTELHELLLARHCRTHSVVLRELVSGGISRAGVVWAKWPRPFEIRGYAINLLLHCVKIHADTMSIVPSELKRVLGAALEVICGVFREEVDMIAESLSLHSAEQLNLELNFITTTLEEFETAVSAGRAKMCRTLLSKKRLAAIDAMDRKRREEQAADDANFQQIHHAAFMANEIMFCCFRTEPPAMHPNGSGANGGAADAAAAAAMAAKTGAERRRAEQQRLGATAMAPAASPGQAPGRGSNGDDDAAETQRPTKAEAGVVGSAFFHSKPMRASLVGRSQTQLSSSAAASSAGAGGAAGAGAGAAQARALRQSRLEASTRGSADAGATATAGDSMAQGSRGGGRTRPRTPPGRGLGRAAQTPTTAISAAQGNAVANRRGAAGAVQGQSLRNFSTAHHVKPRQPVVVASTDEPPSPFDRKNGGGGGGGGSGLSLSPASVAQSATSRTKPPSPPPRQAPTGGSGSGGMASVAAAAKLTGAARVGKARRRRGGDV